MTVRARIPGTELRLCKHFGACGGCTDLDVHATDALRAKVDATRTALARWLGDLGVEWTPAPRVPVHYRTRLLHPVRRGADGRAALGLFARGSHELVAIEECRVQDRRLTELSRRLGPILDALGLEPYDEVRGTGFVRALLARIAPGNDELLVSLVTRPGEFPAGREFAARVAALVPDLPRTSQRPNKLAGVVRSIDEAGGNFLLGHRHVPLLGRDHLVDRQDGLSFRIGVGSFYQVHRNATQVLYRPALEMLGDVRGRRVVDGYGGVGTFGLRLARAGAANVEIVEESASACRDAEHNARTNRLAESVTVQQAPFATATIAPDAEVMVVDPTRAGLGDDGAAAVLAARPRRLLHVACALPALVRDLERLCADGAYRVTAARVCDMFPHTPHVEVLVRLDRA